MTTTTEPPADLGRATSSIGPSSGPHNSWLGPATLATTCINIAFASAMVVRILWHAKRAYLKRRRRRKDSSGVPEELGRRRRGRGGGGESGRKRRRKREEGGIVPTEEVFPLILGIAIILQGIVLAVVAGARLHGPPAGSCRGLLEVAWVGQFFFSIFPSHFFPKEK